MSATNPIPQHPGLDSEIERLYRDHHEMVLRTAYRITRDLGDAEDVLHGLFLRLLRREPPPVPAGDPGPYLHRAAVNQALDLLRQRTRRPSVELSAHTGIDMRPRPDEENRRRELGDRLRAAIARLSPRAAEIFVLRHVEGLTNAEIGRRLGTSWSVVAVTLHRARRRLRRELQS